MITRRRGESGDAENRRRARRAEPLRLCLSASLCFILFSVGVSPSAGASVNATITGRVTNRGKAIAGLDLFLEAISNSRSTRPERIASTRTDSEGRYTFTGIEPGTYNVRTESPLYVAPGNWAALPSPTMAVPAGRSAVNFDLTLIRAGRISGTVNEAEGVPWIDQFVQLDRLDEANNVIAEDFDGRARYLTDDHGVYHATGIPPGRYRVSSGQGVGSISPSKSTKTLRRTFHPETMEARKAAIVEVSEGDEIKAVDIRMAPTLVLYTISGRVIDPTTGEGVNVAIGYEAVSDSGASPSPELESVGKDGEFRFEGLRRGRYRVFLGNGLTGDPSYSIYAKVKEVEIVDADVADVQILVNRGVGVISGEVVIEGAPEKVFGTDSSYRLMALLRDTEMVRQPRMYIANVAPDGRFTVGGLIPGTVTFSISGEPVCAGGFSLVRVERNGVTVDGGIDVGPGDHIPQVRVVFTCGRNSIRGRVLIEGGSVSGSPRFAITARRARAPLEIAVFRSIETDADGNFVINALVPDEYIIEARPLLGPGPQAEGLLRLVGKSTVSVVNGRSTEVTITIKMPR